MSNILCHGIEVTLEVEKIPQSRVKKDYNQECLAYRRYFVDATYNVVVAPTWTEIRGKMGS